MNIFGWKIKVSVRRDPNHPNLAAWFDSEKREILVQKDTEYRFQSLLHECGHGLLIRLGFNQTSLHKDNHELIVEAFSVMLDENWDELCEWRKKLTSKNK